MFIKSFGLKDSPPTEAKAINLIIGDNGAGKSTLLERIYLASSPPALKEIPMAIRTIGYGGEPLDKITIEFNERPAATRFISGTYEASRNHASYFSDDMRKDISQMKASSGQSVLIGLSDALQNLPEGSALMLDEPEKGLDIKTQITLSALFLGLAEKRRCQLFIATHSLVFMTYLQRYQDVTTLTMCDDLKSNPVGFGYVDIVVRTLLMSDEELAKEAR